MADAPTLPEVLRAWQGAAPQTARTITPGQALAVGHFRLELGAGRASILASGSRTAGFFFQGRATARYESVLPADRGALAFQVEGNTQARVRQGAVTFPVAQALVWTLNGQIPDFAGTPAEGLEGALADHLRAFAAPTRPPHVHRLAYGALNAPTSQVTVVAFQSGTDRLVYLYDEAQDRVERLELLKPHASQRPELARVLTLSEQPLGWEAAKPLLPDHFLVDLDLDLQEEAGGQGRFKAVETLASNHPAHRLLTFDLLSFLRIARSGADDVYPVLKVTSVQAEDGRSLAFHHEGHHLVVDLGGPAGAEDFRLTFQFEGAILQRPTGVRYWHLLNQPWFPMAPAGGNMFTLKARMRTPGDQVSIAPGRTVKRAPGFLEVAFDRPLHAFPVSSGAFVSQERVVTPKDPRAGSVTLRQWSYLKPAAQDQVLLDHVASYVEGALQLLGPFPLPELNLVWVPEAEAFPALDHYVEPAKNAVSGFQGSGSRPAPEANLAWVGGPKALPGIIHHGGTTRFSPARPFFRTDRPDPWVAHGEALLVTRQYFGVQVKPASRWDAWLTEALAVQAAQVLVGAVPGTGKAWREDLSALFQAEARRVQGTASLLRAQGLFSEAPERVAVPTGLYYSTPAALLDEVGRATRDRDLTRFLRQLQSTFRWKLLDASQPAELLRKAGAEPAAQAWERTVLGTPAAR